MSLYRQFTAGPRPRDRGIGFAFSGLGKSPLPPGAAGSQERLDLGQIVTAARAGACAPGRPPAAGALEVPGTGLSWTAA
jgi:hypothetical protein